MSTIDQVRTDTLTYFLRPGDPAPVRPASLYLALFTADPGTSGAATNELAASGYARQAITFDPPVAGQTQDATAVTFGPATGGDWPQVTHVAVCAGGTAGVADLLYVGTLSVPATVAAGESLRVAADQLTITVGTAAVSGSAGIVAAAGTRLFSYVPGDSLAGAVVSRASEATYRDTNGVLQTVTSNTLRDAHYIGATRTLLLEAQAVNLLPYTEQLDNAAYRWYNVNAVMANDQVSPDGAQTAERLVEDTSTSFHDIEIFVPVPDNTDHTMSVFCKGTSRQWAYGDLFGKDRVDRLAWFDLANGAVGTVGSGVLGSTIEAYQNGWYRTAIAANSASGVDDGVYCVAAASTTDGASDYTGDGTSGIALFGFQLESGRYPTSYIPNSGSGSATREADLLAFQYLTAPQECSGLVRFVELGSATIAGVGTIYIGNDSATGPRLWIDSTGSGYRLVHDNGTAQVVSAVAGAPAIDDSVALRWVLYADGSVELFQSVNGGVESSGGRSVANPLADAWGGQTLRLNSVGTANVGTAGYTKCVVAAGVQSLATLDAPAIPAAPSNLSAVANGTTITLTWTDNATNATGFHIYRKYTSPDGSFTDPDWVLINPDLPVPADTTRFDDSGLEAGATYQYYVAAFNGAGESAPSSEASATISDGPAAPSNLAAVAVSASRVDLGWTVNAADATGNEVHRSITPNFVPSVSTRIATVGGTATQYSDQSTAAETDYYYRIVTVSSVGSSAPSNEAHVLTPAAPPTGAGDFTNQPTGLTVLTDENWDAGSLPPLDGSGENVEGWTCFDQFQNKTSIVQDSTAPSSPPDVLQFRYNEGFGAGNGPSQVNRAFSFDEVFLGCWVWVSPDWEQTASGITKFFYVFQELGGDRRACILTFNNPWGSTSYRLRLANEPNASQWIDRNTASTERFRPGEWHKIELYMKRSSADGAPDGTVKLWLNNSLYMDYTDRPLRGTPFTKWHVAPVWGGGGEADIATIAGGDPSVIETTVGQVFHTGMTFDITGNTNPVYNTTVQITKIDSQHYSIPVSGSGGDGGHMQQVKGVEQYMRYDRMLIAGR